MALIDARGNVLGKDELMSRVWPDRVVEENNLPAQISVLRKVFGADRHLIRTVAGRGYQFMGEIRAAGAGAPAGPSRATNLPEAVSELIGREAELRDVTDLVMKRRLVTLVGAGGIGKTRLSLEVARSLLPRFPDGVFVAQLGHSVLRKVFGADRHLIRVTRGDRGGGECQAPLAGRGQLRASDRGSRRHGGGAVAYRPGGLPARDEPRGTASVRRIRLPGAVARGAGGRHPGHRRRVEARRSPALRCARPRGRAPVRARRSSGRRDGRHLPAPRRDPARHRARRCAHRRLRRQGRRGSP
ncbi:MAG: hypothetical protein DMD81_23350 [Candidatus Rokuibacteriota bacterium]|nr:MAG: hypothetical protein DMD81_23350 [Candidatus Rokubacteria bacterium]